MKLISWNLNGLNAVHKKGHLVKYVEDETYRPVPMNAQARK
jgi:exonuclease III